MGLSELASSQAPNTLAVLATGLLAVTAVATRHRLRWLYAALALVMVFIVIAKNVSYGNTVSGAEGDLDAHHQYADALLWVVGAQVLVGVALVAVVAFVSRLRWLSAIAASASYYAAACMAGWYETYHDNNLSAQYQVTLPVFHWIGLSLLLVSVVGLVAALVRRRKTAR